MSNDENNEPIADRTRSKMNINGTMPKNPNDTIIPSDEPEDEANELDVRQQLEQLKMHIENLTRKIDDKPKDMNTHKYDTFIEQQVLKEKINNITKFSGNKQDDIEEWLSNIEYDFSGTQVSDNIKLKIIPKSLTQDANNWYEQNKHRITTWNEFKVEIRERFRSAFHQDMKFSRLKERKQQLKETGQQFIDAMEKLCFQVNATMTDQEKMAHVKAGLKPSLQEKVLEKEPKSMRELREVVKRVEDIESMLNQDTINTEFTRKETTNSEQIQYPLNSLQDARYDWHEYEQLNALQDQYYDWNRYEQEPYPGYRYNRQNQSRWYQYDGNNNGYRNGYGYGYGYRQRYNRNQRQQPTTAPSPNSNNKKN